MPKAHGISATAHWPPGKSPRPTRRLPAAAAELRSKRVIGGTAFSLLELLVTMSLMMVLGSLALFSMRGSPRAGLDGAAITLTGLLAETRSTALRTGRPAALVIHDDLSKGPRAAIYQAKGRPGEKGPAPAESESGWVHLADGVLLDNTAVPGGKNILSAGSIFAPAWPGDQSRAWRLKDGAAELSLPGFVFDHNGRQIFPNDQEPTDILLRRGVLSGGNKAYQGGSSASSANSTVVRVRKMTGLAAQMDFPDT